MPHLSIPVALGYLGRCVGLYFALLVVWTLLRKSSPKHAKRWMRFTAKWGQAKQKAEENEAREAMKELRNLTSRKGSSAWGSIAFMGVFCAGVIVGHYWPSPPRYTYYNLRLERVVDARTWKLRSPETGPFTADFCQDVAKYKPLPGYGVCKFQYVDRGCMDISAKQDGFWWVKNAQGKTTAVGPDETFEPWPKCVVDEKITKGDSDARQARNNHR